MHFEEITETVETIETAEAMPAWAVVTIAAIFAVTVLLLTLIYMPRSAEILRLRKIIREQRQTIDHMSKEHTAAELEHNTDIGEIGEKLLAAEGKKDQIAEEYSEKLAEAQARTEQSEDLRRQIARAADKLRGEASA